MWRYRLTNKHGNVLLFTVVLVLPIMLIFAGLATDLAYYGDVDNELQRAMDSAALAGAGKLGFSSDNFPDARDAAQQYALANKYRGGPDPAPACPAGVGPGVPCLDRNEGNAGNGDIVLGKWDPAARTFTPSLNGNEVNAVQTRFATTIPTSFLRIIGASTLNSYATATAWAPPPTVPASCVFPIALTWDPTNFPPPEGGGGGGTPPGNWLCGKPASFSTSSTNNNLNTAGWARLTGCGTPSANETKAAVNAAGDPNNCPVAGLKKGDYVGLQGGLDSSIFQPAPGLNSQFTSHFDASSTIEIEQTDPNTGGSVTVYSGKGWKVTVPVIDTSTQTGSCPVAWNPSRGTMLAWLWDRLSCTVPSVREAFAQGGGQVNQNAQIVGWTQYVMTQVIYHGDCVVDNPDDHINNALWPQPTFAPHCSNGTAPKDANLNGIYGYYKCELSETPGSPGAVAALAKPKLVK